MEKPANVHGSLVAWAGKGILLVGESGVGKTACALEIARRGGTWVADDLVMLTGDDHGHLTGYPHDKIKYMAYLPAKGIIDVRADFPSVRIMPSVKIAIVVELFKKLEKKKEKYLTVRQELERCGLRVAFTSIPAIGDVAWTVRKVIGSTGRLAKGQ